MLLGVGGCKDTPPADDTGSESESEAGDPPLECDIPQLFAERCDGSICHHSEDSPAGDLDLVSPGVEQRVSGAGGTTCAGILADPADPSRSLLYTMVSDTPTCGSRMPLGGDPLSEDEIACMRHWISGLLPPGAEESGEDCPGCICEPGDEQSCYGGLAGTADVGICMAGTSVCTSDGQGFGPCEGEVRPHGENCNTPDVDEDCDGQTPACSELWSRAFGDDTTQLMRSVAVDSSGNVYSAGDFEGLVSFGGEPLQAAGDKADIVIAKHDLYGNPIWSKHFGDSSNQYASKIIVDADDNIYFLGRMFGNVDFGGGMLTTEGTDDIVIVKLDGDGKHLWSRVFGSDDPDRAERIAVDGEGNLLMTGAFGAGADFGAGPYVSQGLRDAFVLKLDGVTGDHMFSVPLGGVGDDYGFGIGATANNDIIATGRFSDTLDYGPTLHSAGLRDIYLAKFDSGGNLMWLEGFGGAGEDGPHDLMIDPATDDILLTGFMAETMNFGGPDLVSAGERDMFMARLDANAGHIWSSRHGDAIDQFTSNFEHNAWLTLDIDSNGDVLLGGSLFGSAEFGATLLSANGESPDIFFVRFAADGATLLSRRYGGTGTDLAMDVGFAGTRVLIAGRTYGSGIDFGSSGAVRTAGSSDAVIAKVE